jgi:hypothetical protein
MLIGTVVKTLVLIVLILTLLAMISDDLPASETQSVTNPRTTEVYFPPTEAWSLW